MRFRRVITGLLFMMPLLLASTIAAQDADYPTLGALKNLEIPVFNFGDLFRRFMWVEEPASSAPIPKAYQLGDRESFTISDGGGGTLGFVTAELRGMTDNVLIWVEESAAFWRQRSQLTAEWVDASVVRRFQQLLDYRQPPGIDGDPRVTILLIREPGFWAGGYFDVGSLEPKAFWPDSNERELLVVNLVYDDGSYVSDGIIRSTIAHEYQHNLLHLRDENEEAWLDEGLSVLFEHFVGATEEVVHYAEAFLEAPNISLTTMYQNADVYADYGAAGLFLIYLAERYGDQIIEKLHAESLDGWRAVVKVLQEHADASAEEIFADWVLANYFLDASRGYGYLALDAELEPPRPAATLRSSPASHSGSLPQFSSEYLALDVRGAATLSLRLSSSPEARLIDAAPMEGDYIYYAVTSDHSNSRLTRELDLSPVDAWLEFKIWFDLVEHEEFAHIAVSEDGGETWSIIKGRHTRNQGRDGSPIPDSYTGNSGGWLDERFSLADYDDDNLLVRFEIITRSNSTYRGMAIDDLRIDAIGFHDGFESPDDAWIAEGWIRTDNRLPNNTWLQVVQDTGTELHVDRALVTGNGDLTVDVLPGLSQALVAISPVVPQTSFPTEYELEAYLVDAEGEIMVVTRDCKLTTTTGLNFRDAPDGNKIGLLPQGTAVWALDSRGDWFNVEYDGLNGWIHGGYVTTEGNCG